MTIAENHGKISSTGTNLHNQMEDLLTSDVFSACKYVRPESLLLPLLRTASSYDGLSLADSLPDDIHKATYFFWPRLVSSEPDLVILLEDMEDRCYLVLIEAKYYSGKSGGPLSEDELEIASTPSDQLASEYQDLKTAEVGLSINPQSIIKRALVYVTAHRSIPTESLHESLCEIKYFLPNEDPVEVYWVSWFAIVPVIEAFQEAMPYEEVVLDDLLKLMKRKRFIQFSGFERIAKVSNFEAGDIYSAAARRVMRGYRFHVQTTGYLSEPIFYTSLQLTRGFDWQIDRRLINGHIYERKGS